MYHPDLRKLGMSTADEAKQHYLQQGRAEGRPYKRLRVLLRYTACTGLINQHYSHIAAFTLAAALGAELVLPPAVCRDSFAHYFRCEFAAFFVPMASDNRCSGQYCCWLACTQQVQTLYCLCWLAAA